MTRLLSVFPSCPFVSFCSCVLFYLGFLGDYSESTSLVNQAGSPGASDDLGCLRLDLVIIPDSCL